MTIVTRNAARLIRLAAVAGFMSFAVAPAAHAAKVSQEGRCSIKESAPADPCKADRGRTATGVYPGKSHEACTEAKKLARTNLEARVSNKACMAYTDCSKPCKVIESQ
ncbi:hypothetical protein [Burkholderia thailandensis]|uniref:Membrane protein n=2 Tax=Burkholderia thailandensis TaxID=57975 RepID=A0AAW9CU35_BURTH|nr:hypothetical protein [Burkholderia thailandensis]ABC36473.1 conserved hypothetical protein [Burkholderia thailandensis E264]AHI65552.1 putative membrane protein [Burkholderia thailandensis H0587]AHI72116.1 hypothetical protein BTQ_1612 [Burkholderia thailandensis 2002721723]AHI77856.1 putative membrane protein [Burkholderia thailandensis E444]AIC88669.1 putative membrane protein [Burkholderia thailandensis USAMRU Malaysia \